MNHKGIAGQTELDSKTWTLLNVELALFLPASSERNDAYPALPAIA